MWSMRMMRSTIWHEERDKVQTLAHALDDAGMLPTKSDILYFFEKPYKWQAEWNYFSLNDTMEGFQ